MIKNAMLAVATVAVIGSATPVLAAGAFGNGSPDDRDRRASLIQTKLNDRGVEAVRVEEWGGLIRAYVAQPEGGTKMQFFEPITLERVNY